MRKLSRGMKNRSAAHGQNTLLYTKAYRMITGHERISVPSTILFQRLEWRFGRYPNGFFKFLEPSPANRKYRKGDSWCEELNYTVDEFRAAFVPLGIRHSTRGDYERARNPFLRPEETEAGKREAARYGREALYCSVLDRRSGLTFYYRNHDLVDRKLDELSRSTAGIEIEEMTFEEVADGRGPSVYTQEPSVYSQMPSVYTQEPSAYTQIMNHDPYQDHDSSMAHTDGTHTCAARGAGASECGTPIEAGLQSGSRHSFDTILRWAESQPGVNSALAVATSRSRDGLADTKIAEWLAGLSSGVAEEGMADLPGERDDELLARFLACVESRINPDSFQTWFKPIARLSRDGQLVLLGVPDATCRDWIRANYFDVIEEVLAELGLEGCDVEYRFPA